jgi:hypothetical protein
MGPGRIGNSMETFSVGKEASHVEEESSAGKA